MKEGSDKVKGVLERIVFSNEENHYCVAELMPSNKRTSVTISGVLPNVQCGETLELTGEWDNHPRYGNQFKIKSFISKLPSSVHGIKRYLGSGLIDGIGKAYAKKIVDHFGEMTLKVISEESGRLSEIPGIGTKRVRKIKAAWDEQQSLRDVMMFLQTYGVSNAQCMRLVRQYGSDAQTILRTDPYKLADEIQGIGFKTADRIALNLGWGNHSDARLDAGILYVLQHSEVSGHTCLDGEMLASYVKDLLSAPEEKIYPRIRFLIEIGRLHQIRKSKFVQIIGLYRAEEKLAQALQNVQEVESQLPSIHIEKALDWVQKKNSFELQELQADAIRTVLKNKISVVTGGPGTGKTTIMKMLLDILRAKKVKMLLASPTGRASQRLAEATGHEAQTVHRLLKYDPSSKKFTMNEENPLSCDFLIIDEASMLDTRLASGLICAVPPKAHVLLVGDIDQLPSVGAGNVLKDIIESKHFGVARLQAVFRQSEGSEIVRIAHAIQSGDPTPPDPVSLLEYSGDKDIHFIQAESPEDCVEKILELTARVIPMKNSLNPVKDLQILTPMHRGVCGTINLNTQLQKTLNRSDSVYLQMGAIRYHVGDKVIQMRNNYDKGLFNGDVGYVKSVNSEDKQIEVDFEGEIVDLGKSDLLDIQLAYAISIHKSQGSEYPVVVIPLLKQHYMMLKRNLIYTGITRGKKNVVIVGDVGAYQLAVKNEDDATRSTDLIGKLKEAMKS